MRTAKIMLAVLFCATMARAETLEGLSRRIDDIALGRDTGNQIQDLRVQDDATIGDDLTVSGDAAVTGAATVTGKTTANGELEANADVDINLGSATEEIAIDQTNTVGQANTPLISVSDARTGANANGTNEATLMISAEGTYALAITKGGVDIVGKALAVAPSTTKFMVDRGTCTNGQASVSFTAAFGVAPSVVISWSDLISTAPDAGTNLTLSASSVTTAGFVPKVAALPVGGAYTNMSWIAIGTAP